ncbi:alpha/beta fold hydrolase [Streptomyces sp. SPB162]|uniref:alpha/beta hydrolase family protein n=1 Tax=Streptomyces sp. SPB162 TaxID=2940560 RepID=UPI002406B21F|nr:alpha/beta fold hydrolase [Streptomyces sp. SPB162]MDF9812472.1 pimeloyl-ACP methyl ester carboxylesterase [Streptomyces sp. SPB162]
MRKRTVAVLAATTVIGAGAAVVAAGRYVSDVALKPSTDGAEPDEWLTVHATAAGQVTLTRALASLRPGVYGLSGDGVHAAVGEVLWTTPGTVARRLDRVYTGALDPGTRVRLTAQVHAGDPRGALGLDYAEVLVPGELGPLPAWFVPGDRSTWVIAVHGLGTTRELPLNVLPALSGHRFPVLGLGYRNDPGAPASPDGLGHLGDTEWRDLDAAMRYAVEYGAERIVLYGWSTGATMALRAADHSGLRDRISGLILDSPVLDWKSTVRSAAFSHGVPGALVPLGVRAAEGRTGLHAERISDAADPDRLSVPTLIAHGPDDTLSSWSGSRQLAARRPELVTLHTVPGASHGAMWNVDPVAYEEALRRFLTPLM